jgi:hypothetical protein
MVTVIAAIPAIPKSLVNSFQGGYIHCKPEQALSTLNNIKKPISESVSPISPSESVFDAPAALLCQRPALGNCLSDL